MSANVENLHHDMRRQSLPLPFAGRLLLVDDMQEDADLLAMLLAPLGASMAVARSAEEALVMLDKHIVDVLVTDLNMPGASGLDLAREVQQRPDAPAVIFVTGSQCAEDKVTAFELGAAAYLQKPVNVEDLTRLARKLLRARSGEPPNDAVIEGAAMTSAAADEVDGSKR